MYQILAPTISEGLDKHTHHIFHARSSGSTTRDTRSNTSIKILYLRLQATRLQLFRIEVKLLTSR